MKGLLTKEHTFTTITIYKNKMTFQEILNEEGLYTTSSFRNGYAFKVTKSQYFNNNELKFIYYKDKDDLLPTESEFVLTNTLVNSNFKKVFTRYQLFK